MRIFVGKGDPICSNCVSFDVDEDHEFWPDIRRWIIREEALDICRTSFSEEEILGCEMVGAPTKLALWLPTTR